MASATPEALRNGEFVVPKKKILSENDLHEFVESDAYNILINFIKKVNDKVKGRKNSDSPPHSELTKNLCDILDQLREWVKEIPPQDHSNRFGDKAFRDWYDRLTERSPEMLTAILPAELKGAVLELSHYFVESFGNRTRIDYGSGHENCFVAFLCCLDRLGLFTDDDLVNVAVKVFVSYLEVARCLQTVYWLEPAGSKGSWGLDDYQFLPFLWGASQLVGHKNIKPKSITSKDVIEGFSKEYIYLTAIGFIHKVKKGPFFEHSPILHSVSQSCPHWEKVNGGMIKMYVAEVMQKFPVIQHFYFGSLIPFQPTKREGEARCSTAAPAPSHAFNPPVPCATGAAPWAKGTGGAMPGGAMPGTAAPWAQGRGANSGMPPGAAGVPGVGVPGAGGVPMGRAPWAGAPGAGVGVGVPTGVAPWVSKDKPQAGATPVPAQATGNTKDVAANDQTVKDPVAKDA